MRFALFSLAALFAAACVSAEAATSGAALAARDVPAAAAAVLPRAHHSKQRHRSSKKGHNKSTKKGGNTAQRLTYYAGHQLDDPACGGPRPDDGDMIAAVVKGAGYAKCGDRITLEHNGRQVTVKVVDYCAGCAHNSFDLSKGAFKKLAPLEQGVIEGASFWKAD